jgi:hypothetical protein
MHQRIKPGMLKGMAEQGCRAGAVDIVVTEDRDALAGLDRAGQPQNGLVEIDHGGGVGQPVTQARLQPAGRIRHRGAPARQQAGEDGRHVQLAADHLRLARRRLVQPVGPAATEDRARDPEIGGVLHAQKLWR